MYCEILVRKCIKLYILITTILETYYGKAKTFNKYFPIEHKLRSLGWLPLALYDLYDQHLSYHPQQLTFKQINVNTRINL